MIKRKYKKLLMIVLCIIFVVTAVTMSIMAQNELHTHHCNVQDCLLCSLINLSMDFIRNIGLVNIDVLILIIGIPLIQLIKINTQKKQKLTLVQLKVAQNN